MTCPNATAGRSPSTPGTTPPAPAEPCPLGHPGRDERRTPLRRHPPGHSRRPHGLTVGALDESGQEKRGQATAGVRRQHMGCAGGIDNGVNTVCLAYVRARTGHALIGARQWIPAEQITDPVTAITTGLSLNLVFATKANWPSACSPTPGATASASSPATGSTETCTKRTFLEEHEQAYVLRVRSSFTLPLGGGTRLTCAQAIVRRCRPRRAWPGPVPGPSLRGVPAPPRTGHGCPGHLRGQRCDRPAPPHMRILIQRQQRAGVSSSACTSSTTEKPWRRSGLRRRPSACAGNSSWCWGRAGGDVMRSRRDLLSVLTPLCSPATTPVIFSGNRAFLRSRIETRPGLPLNGRSTRSRRDAGFTPDDGVNAAGCRLGPVK
ncbi:transposase [Nonomuraea rubra]|uniref:transposase n=1 Tax=Nonomuraea rubra TaxID=46180 RepID=UPI0033C0154B